jgi:hypothetical protein
MEANQNDLEFTVVGRHETYNGQGDLGEFLRSFEQRAELEEWDAQKKRRMIVSLCKGEANIWLRCTPGLMELSYEEIKELLEDRFQEEVTPAEAYVRLMSLRLGNNTMRQYARKLEMLVAEYRDVVPEFAQPDTRDGLMIKIFTNGLPPRYQTLLMASAAQGYTNLLKMACGYEKSFGSRQTVGALAPENEYYFHDDQPDYYGSEGEALRVRERRFTPAARQATNETFEADNQVGFRGAPTCFRCGKTGHVQRYCRGGSQAGRGGYRSSPGYSYQSENWRANKPGINDGGQTGARGQEQRNIQNGGWRTQYSRGAHADAPYPRGSHLPATATYFRGGNQQARGGSFSKN